MSLTMHQLVDLRRHLIEQGRMMDCQTENLSPRAEGGAYIGEGEGLGRRSIRIHVQQGFGGDLKGLERIFEIIFSIHAKSGLRYWLGCFSFGWEDRTLRAEAIFGPREDGAAGSLVQTLAQLATAQSHPPAFLPSLSSSVEEQRLAEEDLLVFICGDRPPTLGKRAEDQCQGLLARNAIWVYAGSDGTRLAIGMRCDDHSGI